MREWVRILSLVGAFAAATGACGDDEAQGLVGGPRGIAPMGGSGGAVDRPVSPVVGDTSGIGGSLEGGGSSGTGGTAGTGGASSGTGGAPGLGGTPGSAGAGGPGDPMGQCSAGGLPEPIPNCRPAVPPSSGDPAQDCVDRINQLRWDCQCLPPLQRWTAGEACAEQHAEYDSSRSPHAGFRDGICSPAGFGQNECPGWRSVGQVVSGCLQAMWDEGPGEPFSQHGHYINMTNPSHSKVACGFYETSKGEVWAVQNFQ